MNKIKNKKSDHASDYMPLDKKSNEDFNNEHPDHDENGLINASATSGMKTTETKSKKKEVAKTYTCSMHSEVISDKPGKCPKCGMELIEKK